MNQVERDHLKKRVKQSGMSQENYLRHLLRNLIPADRPPPEYFRMMNELNVIGNTLAQIAHKAYLLNNIDAERYAETVAQLDAAIVAITNAVMLPRKSE